MEVRRSRFWRARWGLAIFLIWCCVCLGAVLIGAAWWVVRTFGVLTIDQLVLNIPAGDEAGGSGLLWNGILTGIVIPLLAAIAGIAVFERMRRKGNAQGSLDEPGAVGRGRTWMRWFAGIVAVALPLGGAWAASVVIGVDEYVEAYAQELVSGTSLEDFYVQPVVTEPQSELFGEKRNLIVIYLESIEDAFTDDQLFETNMLAPIEEATTGWNSVPALRQYEGGGWTMAGIVATQCGVPLRTSTAQADNFELNELDRPGQEIDTYLQGARCLGDVLSDAGYTNVYLGGAAGTFAGKSTFFETHGFDEVYDLERWRAEGEFEERNWGLSDRRLLANATETVDELARSGQPFNLTMLTLDTHEKPYVYPFCEVTTEVELESITRCSTSYVAEFLEHVEAQGYLENTTVVVMGDHLKQVADYNQFYTELTSLGSERTVFNRISSPDDATFAREDIDQLSMYPTLIELAGLQLANHRAGVGVSALANENDVPAGSILDLTPEEYRNVVRSPSLGFYATLWGGERPESATKSSEAQAQRLPMFTPWNELE